MRVGVVYGHFDHYSLLMRSSEPNFRSINFMKLFLHKLTATKGPLLDAIMSFIDVLA